MYAAWLLDPGEAEHAGAGLPARRARRLGRPHVPRRDARPPDVPAARPDRRRRGGRGVRQGRPAARPAVPGRAGDLSARPRARRAHDRVVPAGVARATRTTSASPGLKTAARRTSTEAARPPRPGLADDARRPPLPDAGRSPSSPGGSRTRSSTCSSTKTIRAAEEIGARSIVLGGGVAANAALRARLAGEAEALGIPLIVPATRRCARTTGR